MATKRKTKSHSKKPGAWFVKVRGSYLPASMQGKLTYIPYLAYLGFALVVGLNTTDSLAQAALFIVPNWVAAAVVMTYVASHNS